MASLPKLLWILTSFVGIVTASQRLFKETVQVKALSKPSPNRQAIDASYQALSVELFAFAEYSANET